VFDGRNEARPALVTETSIGSVLRRTGRTAHGSSSSVSGPLPGVESRGG
jgi:hypothetical protein